MFLTLLHVYHIITCVYYFITYISYFITCISYFIMCVSLIWIQFRIHIVPKSNVLYIIIKDIIYWTRRLTNGAIDVRIPDSTRTSITIMTISTCGSVLASITSTLIDVWNRCVNKPLPFELNINSISDNY